MEEFREKKVGKKLRSAAFSAAGQRSKVKGRSFFKASSGEPSERSTNREATGHMVTSMAGSVSANGSDGTGNKTSESFLRIRSIGFNKTALKGWQVLA